MNDTNAFLGNTVQPTEKEVASAPGPAASVWNELLDWLRDGQKLADHEWNSHSPKYGWALQVKRKKRNIVYMAPGEGCFRVMFLLGGKAVAAARATKLPKTVSKHWTRRLGIQKAQVCGWLCRNPRILAQFAS